VGSDRGDGGREDVRRRLRFLKFGRRSEEKLRISILGI
jgi:hypothetical protein